MRTSVLDMMSKSKNTKRAITAKIDAIMTTNTITDIIRLVNPIFHRGEKLLVYAFLMDRGFSKILSDATLVTAESTRGYTTIP
jgi:hypothetical protein